MQHVSPKLEPSVDLERINGKYEGDYARLLRATYSFSIQVEAVSKYLKSTIHDALYGIRYGYFLDVLILLTAKANADAERISKMEDENKKSK